MDMLSFQTCTLQSAFIHFFLQRVVAVISYPFFWTNCEDLYSMVRSANCKGSPHTVIVRLANSKDNPHTFTVPCVPKPKYYYIFTD